MTAVTESAATPASRPVGSVQTLTWLLRREYWENRGGFFWAQVITGLIATLFALLSAIAGVALLRNLRDGSDRFEQDAFDERFAQMSGAIGDMSLATGIVLAWLVLTFVLFFYLLGSLYDDRRDRSLLFWRSLPISDVQMVLSKLAWALLLAPLLALAIGIATGLLHWLVAVMSLQLSGLPGSGVITASHSLQLIGQCLLMLPVQALWSLPTVGWLMLCSAGARRVPFLWATLAPLIAGMMISFSDTFPGVDIPHDKVWYPIYRALLSIAPGSWLPTLDWDGIQLWRQDDALVLFRPDLLLDLLARADIWIGAVIGIAMIAAATRLRRWRDDA